MRRTGEDAGIISLTASMKGFPRRGSDHEGPRVGGAHAPASMKGFPRRGSDPAAAAASVSASASLNEGLPQKGKRSRLTAFHAAEVSLPQ